MVKVLIVDDHEVVRQGLRFMLTQEPGFQVVGEAADGQEALEAIRRLAPDVVLLDLVMPGLDGLGVLHALNGQPNRPAVIVLTSYADENKAIEAMRVGALSYLPKTTPGERVTEAVRAAATGGSVMTPTVAAALVHRWREREREGPLERLSARERDVLVELSRGRSNREIARSLSLGEQTVKSHVSSILTKLDLQDRTQAAIFGLQHGLVPLGEALQTDD
ncbi:response regulator [Dactylosporangium siamense]|uniref:DNA-binding response regulator n=1 Tax=Dactylosporangium siamense TaxID=685454 RepID=A0A919PY39_9ACTN|nr:response regulator transcription factor [Dactylosporangium siamense]GIG52459.1 DNA-binding response regulator [Dactylosporangium siamense]